MRLLVLICYATSLTLAGAATLDAQDCDAILHGLYEDRFVSDYQTATKQVLEVIKQYQASSYEQAHSIGASLGIEIPMDVVPIPLRFGFHSDENNKGNWVDQLEKQFAVRSDYSHSFTESVHEVNTNVVDAWTKCMDDRRGMIVVPDIDDKDRLGFVLYLSYKRLFGAERTAPPKITQMSVAQGDACVKPGSSNPVGKILPYKEDNNPLAFGFVRTNGYTGPITVSFHTNNNNVNGNIKIKGLPDQPTPPPPSIAATKLDFDGDRWQDTVTHSGNTITVNLANGVSQTWVGSKDFKDNLGPWIYGDFNGDGLTDIAYIVLTGVNNPGYVHVFFSRGDGTFNPPTTFNFNQYVPLDHAGYDSKTGSWEAANCAKDGRTSLKHWMPTLPKQPYYYWLSVETGHSGSVTFASERFHTLEWTSG